MYVVDVVVVFEWFSRRVGFRKNQRFVCGQVRVVVVVGGGGGGGNGGGGGDSRSTIV